MLQEGLLRIEARQTLVTKRAIDFCLPGNDESSAKESYRELLSSAGYKVPKEDPMASWKAMMAALKGE